MNGLIDLASGCADQRVGDFVLHVTGRDAVHPLVDRLLAQFLDVVLGEAGQALAVVELELLQERQTGVLRFFQPRQNRPHGGHFDRVRGNMLPLHRVGVVVLLINVNLVGQPGDVGHVDLHRPVAQGFHELVVLQAAILGLVRMAQDDFVDVGLGELLGFDLVLLAGPQQVVQKGDVELQDFDKLDQAAVRDIELAVEIKRPRIAIAAIFGDFAIVDVAGQLGAVLILFVFRLESADADAVLFAENDAADAHVVDHARPVAGIFLPQIGVDVAAERAEIADDRRQIIVRFVAGVELGRHVGAEPVGNQVQRLLVHRAPLRGPLDRPTERVERPLVAGRIALEPLFQQSGNRALAAADRPVQQQHALFDAVATRGALEGVDQKIQRGIQSKHGVAAAVVRVAEESIPASYARGILRRFRCRTT